MVKRVKYDPKLPTIPGGERQGSSLSQKQLDTIIRKAAAPCAIQEMIGDDHATQPYLLSDGRMLRIWKATGECHIGCTTNKK
jgi:hypothetical protein